LLQVHLWIGICEKNVSCLETYTSISLYVKISFKLNGLYLQK
jgi:hypothetical protein